MKANTCIKEVKRTAKEVIARMEEILQVAENFEGYDDLAFLEHDFKFAESDINNMIIKILNTYDELEEE